MKPFTVDNLWTVYKSGHVFLLSWLVVRAGNARPQWCWLNVSVLKRVARWYYAGVPETVKLV
jgi:hypothetical protein